MHALYDVARRVFFLSPPLFSPVQFVVDAPFGRFTPSNHSAFLLDGIRAWMAMELVAPVAFVYSLANNPLATSPADVTPLAPVSLLFAALYLVHYANRALLSPLRTPSRSKQHVSVTLSGICFNIANATLLATYIRSPIAAAFLTPTSHVLARLTFWVGVALWAAGFAGNMIHDEVLLTIRRNARAKGKARAKSPEPSNGGGASQRKQQREHYGIPHGYLYAYVSYPNYFCEWVEWFGFALAFAPIPDASTLGALVASVQPPWIFFFAEVCLMIGRAFKGHRWYLANFADYPRDRRVVIPFVF